MLTKNKYIFPFEESIELEFITKKGVFTPTRTSWTLFNAFKARATRPVKVLDLGCGCGLVGILAKYKNLIQEPLYASDLSENAVECTRLNGEKHGCRIEARAGSLFEPWNGEQFDVILDDVSGVARAVADVSPWFKDVPCATGEDGTDLVRMVLKKAPNHLNNGGELLFPIISLSRNDRILDEARKHFKNVEMIYKEEWPLPPEMAPHVGLLKTLRSKGLVNFHEKFGLVVLTTEIYCAFNERS